MKKIKALSLNKQKSSTFPTLLLTLLLSPAYAATQDVADTQSEITFLTWGEYIDEEVVAKFEDEYNAKINFVYYESDDTRDEILTTSGPGSYDLILVDSVAISFYQKLGWISEFDKTKIPNLENVHLPNISGLNKRGDPCSAYTWGTTGIAYRKDLVPEPITSWKQIFEPVPALRGRILMSSLAEETVGMALKSLNYSMASSNKKELAEARQLLVNQAPMVAGYSAVAVDHEKSKLVTGEVSAIVTYSGDALMLQESEPKIEYVIPREGGAIWADFVCLSASASNSELAHHFVDFINRPQLAARNALFFYSATPNREAEKLLPEEFLNNKLIYPDLDVLKRSELYQALPSRRIKKQISIMNELRKLSLSQ